MGTTVVTPEALHSGSNPARQHPVAIDSDIRAFKVPDPALVRITYDWLSDILTLRVAETSRPSFVSGCIGETCLILDAETKRIVGFHVDNFLAAVVKDDPSIVSALTVAELRGLTRDDAERIVARVSNSRPRILSRVTDFWRKVRHQPSSPLPPAHDLQTIERTVRSLVKTMTPAQASPR